MRNATSRSGRRAVLGLTAAVALASCGGSGSSSGTTSPTGDTGSATSPAGAAKAGSEEFGLTLEELATRIEQVEGAIGICMTEAGFEYVPVDYETVKAAMDSDESVPGISDEEYIAQFGFGITTRLNEPDPVVQNGKGEQNLAFFAALPVADQVAYTRTLYGENEQATLSRALEDEDFSEIGGCTLTAVEQFFAVDELSSAYVNPVDLRLEQDPRMIAALGDWSTCLLDAGYEYDHPDDINDDLRERVDALLNGADPATLTGPTADALTELQGYERAVAVVATDCEDQVIKPVEEKIESEIYGAPQN